MSLSSDQRKETSFSYFMVIECMMKPVRLKFKSSECMTIEQVSETIQAVEAIIHMISSASEAVSDDGCESDNEWDQVIVTFVKDVCLPILHFLPRISDSAKRNCEKIKARCVSIQAMATSCRFIRAKSTLCHLVFQILSPLLPLNNDESKSLSEPLKDIGDKNPGCDAIDTLSLLEIFIAVWNECSVVHVFLSNLPLFGTDKDPLLRQIFHSMMITSKEDGLFSKSLNAISKLFTVCPASLQTDFLSLIWHQFTQPLERDFEGTIDKKTLWQSLFAFFCFKDFLFPLELTRSDVLIQHLGDEFWTCIQEGLLSIEPSHRKLSMYLLKRLVDTCHQNSCTVNAKLANKQMSQDKEETTKQKSPQAKFWWSEKQSSCLLEVWEDFILLMETLEDRQVHVIKPVLSRMTKLLSSFSVHPEEGMFLMHSSWLMIIFIRCFHHESHYMSRWGAVTLLTLDFHQVPLIKHDQMKFLSQDLLEYLQENKLYSRYNDTELGKCSPVGEALVHFFAKLFTSMTHTEKTTYLVNVLQKMKDSTWGSIPMVFLAQGLSTIPHEPLLGREGLLLIRDILHQCLTTHEIQTRGAIQCFFGQVIINLVDLDSVNLVDFFTTLARLNREESFKRGTCLWQSLSQYLYTQKANNKFDEKEILSIACDYLKESKNLGLEEKHSVVFDGSKVISITRMLLLFADADIRTNLEIDDPCSKKTALEDCPLGIILNELQSVMTNIRSRSYINVNHVDSCLAIIQCLGQEVGDVSNDDHVGLFVKAKLAYCFQHAVSFVVRRLSQDLTKPQDLGEIRFYTDVMLTLGLHCNNPFQSLQELMVFVTGAFNLTLQQSSNAEIDMLHTSAMNIFSKVLRVILSNNVINESGRDQMRKMISGMKSIHIVPLPFSKGVANSTGSFSKAHIGYVISSFLSSKWQCQTLMILLDCHGKETVSDLEILIDSSMEAMSLGSGNSDIAVFGALELLVEQAAVGYPSLIPPLLDLAWGKVMEERANILFWRKLESLVPVALHSCLLEPQVEDDITLAVDEFTEKLFTLGQEKSGVIYLMVKHLCDSILKHDEGRQKASRMIPLLLQVCDFGTVHKKWQRLWQDICTYIEGMGTALASNQITSSFSKNDISFRIVILNWLSDMKPTEQADYQFVMRFLRALSDKYLEYAEASTYRHFTNSLTHRQKHRMILILLLLSDFLKEEDCEEFFWKLKTGLELECHPSVTHNLEWIIMRLLIRYPKYLQNFWDAFSEFVQRRNVCLCSLILITSHIGPKLPKNVQLDFFNQAFCTVMPWTMAHHYTTRVFAQTCLICLWQQCSELNYTEQLENFTLLKPTVDFLSNNSNASGTVFKLLDNFIISYFDPVRDFSAETILYTLPRLAAISDDEWISPQTLLQQDERWQKGEKIVPLFNISPDLSKCKGGPWKMKSHAENEEDITKTMHGDFQKKIMPWRQMSPNEGVEDELVTERQKGNKDGLILVTSLIDKLPNLGGLCRTSEIFGVSDFVIGSLEYLEDRMFQSLSVSAQKWLNITEVLLPQIPDYLSEKRREGYTLIGVEQTANSVSLDEYVFPKKSLLVLGNEKEGIPPDMIQTLDVCVEIPQQGIIRSLNVHVCGALIVWEYTRQHLKH